MVDRSYMRPQKSACNLRDWNGYADRTSTLHVRRLSDVAIVAMGQLPGIEPDNNRIIDDCDYYAEISGRDTKNCEHIGGTVLYAGYLRWSWGHFLLNSTARLWPLFNGQAQNVDKIVFFAESDSVNGLKGNFREFFQLLGLIDKCLILKGGTYGFDELIVGEPALEIGCYYSNEFMLPFNEVRRRVLSDQSHQQADKPLHPGIILTRSQWNGNDKMQINLEVLDRLFTSNGYVAVSPERISLSELIAVMNSADEIVSYSGSTAHNILFCNNKPLILLERCAANNLYQVGIMKMMKNANVPVDCFYQPLLTSSTDNLTIYGFTPELKRFAAARGFSLPQFVGSTYKEFRTCLRVYRRHYGYGYGLNQWEVSEAPAIYEAYFDSYARYCKYLDRRRPVIWSDFLSPRVLYRMIADRLHGR